MATGLSQLPLVFAKKLLFLKETDLPNLSIFNKNRWDTKYQFKILSLHLSVPISSTYHAVVLERTHISLVTFTEPHPTLLPPEERRPSP